MFNSTPNQIAKGVRSYTPATVTNHGKIAITPSAPGYHYSTDNDLVVAADDTKASPFATAGMYPASDQTHTVYLRAHTNEDPGTYNLQVLTDVFDSVLETDEANNWSTLLFGDIV